MFSSISKLMSPKTLLASYLSKSLAEFFCVDPEQVEANLVHDAKVVLNDIQLKEKRLGGSLLVSGSVGRIEFSWTWAKASLITDAKLTVKGVAIQVKLGPDEKPNKETSQSPMAVEGKVASAPMCEEKVEASSDWKAKYLQQIVDHLTLIAEDITIAIQMDTGSHVVVEARDMDLRTLQNIQHRTAGELSHSLMQKLRLASIEARVVDNATCSSLPILEPFGYTANVQRISGRRFLDGILSGLMVQGHSSWNDDTTSSHASSTIRVHVGIHQISAFNHLQQMLLLINSQTNSAINEASENSSENHRLEGKKPSVPPTSSKIPEKVISIFRFPFESMEVVLENDTSLKLADCEIRYCTDGTELALESTGGIWMDNVLISQNNSRLILDFVSSELILDSLSSSSSSVSSLLAEQNNTEIFYNAKDTEADEQEEEKGSELVLSVEMIQKLCGGVQVISPQCEEAMAIAEKAIQQQYPSAAASASRWTLRSTGIISLKLTGECDWVRVIANAPKLIQGDLTTESSALFSCLNIRVESSADFSIKIPEVRTERAVLTAKDPIAVELGTIDSLDGLHKLWDEMLGAVGAQSPANSGAELPMNVSVAVANVCVKRPNLGTIKIFDVQGAGAKWKSSAMEIQDVLDISAEAQCLEVNLGANETSVAIEKVTKLSHKTIDYLMSPILKTTLLLDEKGISLVCRDLKVDFPNGETTDSSHNKATNVSMDIRRGGRSPNSLPIHFRADKFSLSSGEKSISAEAVDMLVRATNYNAVDITVKQISGSIGDRIRGACSGIQSSLKFQEQPEEVKSLVAIPGIGKLTTATISFRDISSLVVPGVGYLAPTSNVCVTVDEQDVIKFQGKTIRFCWSDAESNKQAVQEPSDGSINLSLPASLSFKVDRLLVMPEFGAYKPGLCFDVLEFNMIPKDEVFRVDGTCNAIRGRAPNQATTVIKGVNFYAENCQADAAAETMFGLQEAGISMKEISDLKIPGLLTLSEPVLNATLQLQNNVVNANFNSIHISSSGDARDMEEDHQTDVKLQETASRVQIPIDFRLSVSQVIFDFPKSCYDGNELSSLHLSLLCIEHEKPSVHGETSSLDATCGALHAVNGLNRFSLKKASSSINWKDCGDAIPTGGSMYATSIGAISSALIEIDEITECCVDDKYYLSRPLLNTSISYNNGACSVSFDELVLEMSYSNTWTPRIEKKQISNTEKFDLPLNFSWALDARHVVLEPNAGHGDFGVTLDKVSLRGTLPSDGTMGSLHAACMGFRALNPKNVGVVGQGIATNLCLEDFQESDSEKRNILPGFGIVSEGQAKVSLVSMLGLPGLGNISQDLIDTNITYGANGFRITLGCLVWDFHQKDSGSKESGLSSESLDPWLFQYPIEVVTQSLEFRDPRGSLLRCGETVAGIRLDQFDSMLHFNVQLDSIVANRCDGARIVTSVSRLTATIILGEVDYPVLLDYVIIPSVGHLHIAQCEVSEISDMVLPEYFGLQSPMRSVMCRFERNLVSLTCPHVCMERVASKQVSMGKPPAHSTFDLPCNVNVVVEVFEISIKSVQTRASPTTEITCTSFNLNLEPVLAKVGASTESPGAGVYLKCKELRRKEGSTDMLVANLSTSGLIQFHAMDTIGNLVVGVGKAQLHADFKSVNWSGSLEKDPLTVLHLPFAAVPKFDLTLKYAGKLVSIKDANICCDDFEGDGSTTLDEVMAHYVAIVKGRIPYFLSKTSIVGADIGDSVGVMAGTILTRTSVIGATVGVASRDAVGAALNRGKAARGVTASERYRFGDFTRGVVSAGNSARKSGSQRRGSDAYRFGDFTAGTTSAAGKYASENRERLAGAGGSAIGMIAGAALLGPVGFVAGSLLGSSAAQSSVRRVSSNSKGNRSSTGNSTAPSSATTVQEDLQQGQIPDLLSATVMERDTLSPDMTNGSTENAYDAPPLDAEVQMIGEVATSDYRTVMVQARVVGPLAASSRPGAMSRQIDERHVQTAINSETVPSAPIRSQVHVASSNDATVQLQTTQYPMVNVSCPPSSSTDYSYPLAAATPTPRHRQVTSIPSSTQRRPDDINNGLGSHTHGNPGQSLNAGYAMYQQQNQRCRHAGQQTSRLGNQQEPGARQQGYRFGDVTRGIAARGRQVDGRNENSGYKFGDFTRGLFR